MGIVGDISQFDVVLDVGAEFEVSFLKEAPARTARWAATNPLSELRETC